MTKNDSFWDLYWEMRLKPMENLGKRDAILAVSDLIRLIAPQVDHPLRLLELGCGEGQIIGTLLEAHAQLCSCERSVGVDYDARSVAQCRKDFPGFGCIEGDITDRDLLASLGKFDIVLLVNALHEVFSDSYSTELGEIDVAAGKQRVKQAVGSAAGCLEPGGWLVLFDGLEPAGDPQQNLRIRFRDLDVRQDFEKFVEQYQPFHITYRQNEDPLCV